MDASLALQEVVPLSGVEFAPWCGVLLLHRPLLAEPETETQRVMQRENPPRGLMQILPLWFAPLVSVGCRPRTVLGRRGRSDGGHGGRAM